MILRWAIILSTMISAFALSAGMQDALFAVPFISICICSCFVYGIDKLKMHALDTNVWSDIFGAIITVIGTLGALIYVFSGPHGIMTIPYYAILLLCFVFAALYAQDKVITN